MSALVIGDLESHGALVDKPSGMVRSVVQALAILSCVAAAEPVSLSTIAHELKLNTTTCFNILKTLAVKGCIKRDDRAKTNRLGARLLRDHKVLPYDPVALAAINGRMSGAA